MPDRLSTGKAWQTIDKPSKSMYTLLINYGGYGVKF